eukprot:TRINITY_DN3797_c0_g1_i2.p1 TRINITY_DN3797_c0_g1~~TRINITY_DN3797_c0_g1_i2.p1  ORF type:complete len:847 (-),score=240.58 TRINITY_DN3797_c0_g1_i2:167-2707(-)
MGFGVRVHIIEGREFKGVEDGGGMSDPFVLVSVCGQKDQTDKFDKCSAAVFDKMMFFEFPDISSKEFQNGTIRIECFDYNAMTPNVLIGQFEFGVGSVNMRPGHEHHNAWIALLNYEKGFDPQGFLKVSVSAIKDGQGHAEHGGDEEEEQRDESDLSKLVIMPAGMKLKPMKLSCCVYRAMNLPEMDAIGHCDGFIKMTFGGVDVTTEVQNGQKDPTFLEELQLPVMTPSMSDGVEISLWDDDMGISADFIGTTIYSFREISDREVVGPHWAHLYGWPESASEDEIALVKDMKPTEYRGAALLSFATEEDKGARVGKKKCEKASEPEMVQYEFRLDLFQVAELPEGLSDDSVYVKFGLGSTLDEANWKTTEIGELQGNSCSSWLKSKKVGQYKLRSSWPIIKKSNVYLEKQVPDLFVDLYHKSSIPFGEDRRIGFLRFEYNLKNAKQLGRGEIKWHPLTKDPFSGCVDKGDIPGFIQIRMQFGPRKALPRAEGWPTTRSADFLLRAHIYQGKDLPAADEEGTSDAFCVVRMAGQKDQTRTIFETCFPRWYQTIELDVSLPTNTELLPNVNVLLYDEDTFGADYLGRFAVEASMLSPKFKYELGDEDWQPLVTGEKDGKPVTTGVVLATFQLIKKTDIGRLKKSNNYGPSDDNPDGILDIYPEHVDCIFECFLVGIRDLEPYMLQECSDPVIFVDAGDRREGVMAETEQGETPNMSWKELLQIPCELPTKEIFAPNLNVRVFDNRLLGMATVGSASIPVAPYLSWNSLELEPAIPEGVEFADMEDDEEEDLAPPQDVLPTDRIEMNETLHPVFSEFKFDTVVRGGQIGMRSIPVSYTHLTLPTKRIV